MADDWGEVVTRQPLGNQRLDHLLSKEDNSLRKIENPNDICHYLVLRDQGEFSKYKRTKGSIRFRIGCLNANVDFGPVAQFGQSARLISVRSMVQFHPGPPREIRISKSSGFGNQDRLKSAILCLISVILGVQLSWESACLARRRSSVRSRSPPPELIC